MRTVWERIINSVVNMNVAVLISCYWPYISWNFAATIMVIGVKYDNRYLNPLILQKVYVNRVSIHRLCKGTLTSGLLL